MKVMLNRNITPEERLHNIFDKNICPNFMRVTNDIGFAVSLDPDKHEYFFDFLNINENDAFDIIIELQEKGNILPFVCNAYSRITRKLTLCLSEECGLMVLEAVGGHLDELADN